MYSLIRMALIYRIDCQEGLLNYSALRLKTAFKYHRAGPVSKGRAVPITRLPP